jgi:hypothetical protein
MAAPADLIIAGRALYGERWQSALARELGTADRTVRRWVSGEDEPKPGVYRDLIKVVEHRLSDLLEAKAALQAGTVLPLGLPTICDPRRRDLGPAGSPMRRIAWVSNSRIASATR